MGPMYLGVRAVLVKSFARIHRANLINWGVVPLDLRRPRATGRASSATTGCAWSRCDLRWWRANT